MSNINLFSQQKQISLLEYNFAEDYDFNLKLGVFLHIYYIDIIDELVAIVKNVQEALEDFDNPPKSLLCISTDTEQKASIIKNSFEDFSCFSLKIKVLPNKGRDIAPFLVGFAEEIKSVDLVLKLHTKKNLYGSHGEEWRKSLYAGLALNAEYVKAVLFHFISTEHNIGMLVAPHYHSTLKFISVENNIKKMQDILRKIDTNISLSQESWIDFPSGSMFWARSEALLPLVNLNLKFSDFDDQEDKTDGTLAHAVERVFLYSNVIAGFEWVRIDRQNMLMKNRDESDNTIYNISAYYAYAQRKPYETDVNDEYYLSAYPEVSGSSLTPQEHFEQIGQYKGYFPNPEFAANVSLIEESEYFDATWYRLKYADVREKGVSPAFHFLHFGWTQGFQPSVRFDTIKYLVIYPDVATEKMNPLLHYEKFGRKEQRKVFAFEETHRKLNYPDLFKHGAVAHEKLSFVSTFHGSDRKNSRVAVFAFFNKDCIIHDYVVYYLEELKKVADSIVFVADCYLPVTEINKITHIVDYCLCKKHGEYDFGSYKRGYFYALEHCIDETTQELIFCNDSCYGPVFPFSEVFSRMEAEDCDFWGLTSNNQYVFHIQSYFVVFRKNVFTSYIFYLFMKEIKKHNNVMTVIFNYEVTLTDLLINKNFKCGASVCFEYDLFHTTAYPLSLVSNSVPLIKVKSFTEARQNLDGIFATLEKVRELNPIVFDGIVKHQKINIDNFDKIYEISFSIIMPTYNRRNMIEIAINSVINQTYKNYELIIIDDGSEDDTVPYLYSMYSTLIEKNIIKIIELKKNSGPSHARNRGLEIAKNKWIVYLDSDNILDRSYLQLFADSIIINDKYKCFYCKLQYMKEKIYIGRKFDYTLLKQGNFIDLGTFVHHIDLYREFGGFDERLNRLVDWDLILRYTEKNTPFFIDVPLLYYNNDYVIGRITSKNNFPLSKRYIVAKNNGWPKITTLIISYNQKQYISQAIESALLQQGNFQHEILISDDGSNDGSAEIIEYYARKYPMFITNISTVENKGIAENYKYAFGQATGDFVAVLEGDDYWSDQNKLMEQMTFLQKNQDCSMVFSRLHIMSDESLTLKALDRHNDLPSKLSVSDFISRNELSLIVNLSTCMYRKKIINMLPLYLFNFRFSEISSAFFIERFGTIGFIDKIQSVYRQHSNGIWSGSCKREQLKHAYLNRLTALLACQDKYKENMSKYIKESFLPDLEKEGICKKELEDLFFDALQVEYHGDAKLLRRLL